MNVRNGHGLASPLWLVTDERRDTCRPSVGLFVDRTADELARMARDERHLGEMLDALVLRSRATLKRSRRTATPEAAQ